RLLTDLGLFSRYVVGRPLRPYQLEPARAILDSVLHRKGLTFTVMMARQAGKNELSAQLELYLLNLFQRRGGNIVKCAPTFKPQIVNSKLRLQQALENEWNRGRWRSSYGYIVSLGNASVMFFSAEESANVVGATAHLLLEVDEAQDVSAEKYAKEFRPMGATTNVTTVLYGTAWTADTLLEQQKEVNLAMEAQDGVRRHFQYDWRRVAAFNPDYRRYVEAEIARLGDGHPILRTQYLLETIAGASGFLSDQQRAQMRGDHPRQHSATAGREYVAGIDLAGEDEEAADAALRALKPRKDSTVITVAELDWSLVSNLVLEPRLKVVEHYYWTGRKHRDQYVQMVDLLRNVWDCRKVVVDATGVGAGVAGFLVSALGRQVVVPFVFSAPSKSRLAYDFLGAVNAGRFKLYREDGSPESREFWLQAEQARYTVGANQAMDFYVPPERGHDDFLMSAALAVQAAGMAAVRRATGRRAQPTM
ncbi:MAG: hypothetical protein ACM3US_00275, partial [Sphingomonadaceae bacterium]